MIQMPHPLEHQIVLKIQTTPDIMPITAFKDALIQLLSTITVIKEKFQNELMLRQNMNIDDVNDRY